MERPKQTDCQIEPSYPNHETVVFSIRYPDYYMDKDLNVKKFDN